MKTGLVALGLTIVLAQSGLAQKPTIKSIVNAASYAAPQLSLFVNTIAPGTIATIFGNNLAASTVEVRLFVESEDGQVQNFTAPGLMQGGQHRWIYEWRFGKIQFQ